MEDKKYYKTLSRGMMNFLVERGHTDIKYEENERGKIVFCWLETNKLNKDIELFYETDRDVDRRKRAKIVGTPWLVRELAKLGYEPFTTEVSIFDWRKKVYLYDYSNSLQAAIDRLLAEKNKNNANFLEDEDAKR